VTVQAKLNEPQFLRRLMQDALVSMRSSSEDLLDKPVELSKIIGADPRAFG
jgi:hypothetical protein